MKIKYGSIALVLIQVLAFSAMQCVCLASPFAEEPVVTPLAVGPEVSWDFERVEEWREFARGDEDSAELIVGVSNTQPNSYVQVVNLIAEYGGEFVETISGGNEVLAVVADMPFDAMSSFATKVQAVGLSRYIEPNMKVEAFFEPDDPYWNQLEPSPPPTWTQWGPRKIEANYAWNISTGDPSIVVAVIDTGIDYNHPDLKDHYFGSGLYFGWDWANGDPDPMDDNGHGTHCAGIIAAVLNNSIGIAGLGNVTIMAEKVLDSYGGGWASDIANGIGHAAFFGADILSMSFGGWVKSETILNSIMWAYNHGVLSIAAVGNSKWDVKQYPAAFDKVVAVTATDWDDNPASFTNFGDWVDVAAPGVKIYSTYGYESGSTQNQTHTYAYMSGTSMAAPHVAGVAALILSCFPNMTHDQVRAQLRYTSEDLGSEGFDEYYGYGRINARKALEQELPERDLLIMYLNVPYISKLGDVVAVNTNVHNFGETDENNITVTLLVNNTVKDSMQIDLLESGKSVTISFSWTPEVEGRYNVTSYVEVVGINETNTENNARSAWKVVRTEEIVKVPEDCAMIQKAIEVAPPGYTIQVASGTYYEAIFVPKPLRLVGEDSNTTIIDGMETPVVVDLLADNISISGFTIRNGWCGIQALTTGGHIISGNIISDNNFELWFLCGGIYLYKSTDNTISDNTLLNNTFGIWFDDCNNSLVSGNTLLNNSDVSIWIWEFSNNNTITHNYIQSSFAIGIEISQRWFVDVTENNVVNENTIISSIGGIYVKDSAHTSIVGNRISNNRDAGLALRDTTNNTIIENQVSYNDYGIYLDTSSNNTIHHNNFINNTVQAYLHESYDNIWISVNFVGNYWSDYTGQDIIGGGDGIGDTPYVIDDYNKDKYPLMWKWFPGDLDGDGDIDCYDLVLFVYAYESYVGDEKYASTPCCDLVGNTTGSPPDGYIDRYDFGTFAYAYGSKPGDPNWDPRCDLDKDGDVDAYDLGYFADAYGSEGDPRYNKLADLDYDGDVDAYDLVIFWDNYWKH